MGARIPRSIQVYDLFAIEINVLFLKVTVVLSQYVNVT